MTQFYFNPERESDPYALPDGETFYVSPLVANYNTENLDHADDYTVTTPGWYYWSCFPGCLPDSDPTGPFANEAEALSEARS
jgi:hypothetical protein